MRHRVHNRLPRGLRLAIYLITTLLVASGVAWLVVVYALAPPGEPTPAPHALAGPVLAAHGVVAYLALAVYALVGHAHLRTGWRVPALRVAASWMCAALLLLIGTGLGFYYFADEATASALRWSHVAAGTVLPFSVALHIVRGRRVARRS